MSVIELPDAMKQPHGITAVYLNQLLVNVGSALREEVDNGLLQHCMIDNTRLENDRYYRVPFFKVNCLLETIYNHQQNPLTAINAVFRLRVKSFPLIGYAVAASSTLQAAIERLAKLETVVWDVGSICQQQRGEYVRLIWRPTIPISPLVVEMAIAGWVSIGKQLFSSQKRLHEVTFSHRCLGNKDDYAELFDCPVTFGADENSIIFPCAWLDETLIDSDDSLADLMTAQATSLIDDYVQALNIENAIRSTLLDRLPEEIPDLDRVAQLLEIPVRKIRYLLTEKGLSYRQIVDDVRKDVASYLLLQEGHSIGEIAGFCGFLEQSSFNRAFKRWFNCAPTEYAEQRISI